MKTQTNYRGGLMLLSLLLMASCLSAQVLRINAVDGNANTNAAVHNGIALVAGDPPPQPLDACNMPAVLSGALGADFGIFCGATASIKGYNPYPHLVTCHTTIGAFARGDQTSTISLNWMNTVSNYSRTDGYWAVGDANLNFEVQVGLDQVAPGATMTVYYEYSAFMGGSTDHETDGGVPPLVEKEDPIDVQNTLTLDGQDMLPMPSSFTNPTPAGGGSSGWNQVKNQYGSFQLTEGTNFHLIIGSMIDAAINPMGKPAAIFEVDQSDGIFHGQFRFSLAPFTVVTPGQSSEKMLFSLDIGSDCEYGDPYQDGDEAFDPGDAYEHNFASSTITTFLDDQFIFGLDPIPDAPGPQIPYHSIPMDFFGPDVFDLDGLETSNYNLELYTQLVPFPFLTTPSDCLPRAVHFAISYDDDTAENWSDGVPSLPVESLSPAGVTHGRTSQLDEVISATAIGNVSPGVVQYPFMNEGLLHSALTPNATVWEEDDDCDALAMDHYVGTASMCPYVYFSCDREGRYYDPVTGVILDPGTIYQVGSSGGVTPVITPPMLGLSPGTDIDAFTFGAHSGADLTVSTFALYFSVDEDDPMTPEDESGGLNPRIIYYSIMLGQSWPYFDQPFEDDIDALTLTSQLYAMGPPIQPCPGDLNGDGYIGSGDLLILIASFGCQSNCGAANLTGGPEVNSSDLLFLLGLFGTTCP